MRQSAFIGTFNALIESVNLPCLFFTSNIRPILKRFENKNKKIIVAFFRIILGGVLEIECLYLATVNYKPVIVTYEF